MENYLHCSLKPWYLQLNYLAVFAFMVVLPFLKSWGARPLLVIGLTVVAMLRQFSAKTAIWHLEKPKELHFYCLWGMWSLVIGNFICKDGLQFFECAKMLVRTMLLIWVVFALFSRQRQHVYFLFVLITVAVIQAGASLLGFHVANEENVLGGEIVRDVFDGNSRVEGLTGNANAMGSMMLFGIWAAILLWNRSGGFAKLIKRVVLLVLMALFAYFIIQTASRKSLMVACVLIVGWLMWMIPGRLSFKAFITACFMGLILISIAFFVFGYVMPDTVMAHRFQQWFDAGGGSAAEGFKANVRYWMYVDGFKFFLDHPIIGLGLGQFKVYHWSGLYSHSDYMEPLACTGFVGFILYHGFALSVTMRLVRLLRCNVSKDMAYMLKGLLLFMICNHYLIGIGGPWWMSIEHNVIVVFIGTYAWQIEQMCVKHRFIYTT